MYRINPDRLDLVEEFLHQPFGHHSAELQRLLNVLRDEPLNGKHILVRTNPGKEWAVAQLAGVPGQAVRLLPGQVYATAEDAERAVFKLRWEKMTGRKLDPDRVSR